MTIYNGMIMRGIQFTFCLLLSGIVTFGQEKIRLDGQWLVRLDSAGDGRVDGWQKASRLAATTIMLPGTLDEAGLGKASDAKPILQRPVVDQLTRKRSYIGAAWYSREVVIPETWRGRTVLLSLERVIWKTEVWVDGIKSEIVNESLVAPHVFDLTSLLTTGKHVLTVCVDNRKQHDISFGEKNFAHAYTDGTQVIWNGILGKIELEQKGLRYLSSVQIFPDVDSSQVRFQIDITDNTGVKSKGELEVALPGLLSTTRKPVTLNGKSQRISLTYKVDSTKISRWDEFNPNMYNAEVALRTTLRRKLDESRLTASFGFRKLGTSAALLQINGRRLFLRGTLECAIFPLTGHPPMDERDWEKVFTTAKSYGLNHLRFHSWCPPDAAFRVADKVGFYLQVELPLWSRRVGKDESVNRFLSAEAERMIMSYGNHPSFTFWSVGNELEGDFDWINNFVATLKRNDPRHLYSTTTFSFQEGHGKWPEREDQFFITQYTTKGWVRGQGVFDSETPNFSKDYSTSIEGVPVPIVAHEIGQYSVYPKMDEIKKYTGILDPLNLKAVQSDLAKKGLENLARDFTIASGKFAVQLYKEEIERALKTKGFSGFQLLDLHDFPGQGTAMVGVLDAFWDSKGFITDDEFKSFCAPVVPLIRYPKAIYTNDESFEASVELANFSAEVLHSKAISWRILDGAALIASGTFPSNNYPVGNCLTAGSITFPLTTISIAKKLMIEVEIEGIAKNSWSFWVYPAASSESTGDVVVTRSYIDAAKHLKDGKKVLLIPDTKTIKGIEGKFVPVFWSPVHFPAQPGTMGLLVNPAHKAFQQFPTDGHSSWQWWDINKNSVVIQGQDPIIRVIDNFFKNRELGILYEFRSGSGKLVLCTADLLTNKDQRPVARQLYNSVLHYMNSSDFAPSKELHQSFLKDIQK